MMMNNYTLDPSKTESAAVPTLASAPAPTHVPAPIYMSPNYQYYPYQYPQAPIVNPNIGKIRDWLPWSIINLFVGGLFLGLIPLIFSLICRSNKKKNDLNGARTMSTLALVFNILITVVSIAVLIGLFIYLYVYTQQLSMDNLRKG